MKTPITLILGEQATGKSMLLKHIYNALTWFPARLKMSVLRAWLCLIKTLPFLVCSLK